MAVSKLATLICLLHAVITLAESMPGDSIAQPGQSLSHMGNFGADYQMHMKQADIGGSYGVDTRRYMNGGALDFTEHRMAAYEPGVARDFPSSLPSLAGQTEFLAGSNGAGYKQQMASYAKGYEKLMGHGVGSASAAGPYQQYMNKYPAGHQQKYTSFGAPGTSQASNFQDYMGMYMADNKDYSGQAGASGKQVGNYQQYVEMHSGDNRQQHNKHAQGYQQYMDKFTNEYNKHHSQVGDYQMFVQDYAAGRQQVGNASQGGSHRLSDYSKYMDHYGGEHSKYMRKFAYDHSKYSGQADDYQKFMQNYASSQAGSNTFGDYSKHMNQHRSDHSQYMNKFAKDYSQFADHQKFIQDYAAGFGHAGPASQGGKFGDYSKYMDQYMGDSHKFTTGHSGMGASKGVDYQKYLSKYTQSGTNSQAGQVGNDQHKESQNDAGDAHHHQQVSHADASATDEPASPRNSSSVAAAQFFAAPPQGAGYKQYMVNYDHSAHYQKYLEDQELQSGSHGAAFQKESVGNFAAAEGYENQVGFSENYMGTSVSDYPKHASRSGGQLAGAANYQKYSSAPQQPASYWKDAEALMREDAASSEPSRMAAAQFFAAPKGLRSATIQEDFKAQYANKYMSGFTPSDPSSGISLQPQATSKPKSLATCHNASEVQAWEDAEIASIEAFVPEAYQESAIVNVKKAAADRTEKLKKVAASKSSSADNPDSPPNPKTPADATKGKTEEEAGENKADTSEPSPMAAAQFFAAPTDLQSAKLQEDFKAQYASKYMSGFVSSDSSSGMSLQAQARSAPKLLAGCHNPFDVQDWEDAKIAAIKAYVPKAYQESAIVNVKKAAANRIEELKQVAASNSSGSDHPDATAVSPPNSKPLLVDAQGKADGVAAAKMTAAQFFAARPALAASHKQAISNPKETGASAGTLAQPEASQDEGLDGKHATKYIHGIAPDVSNYSDQHAWKESFMQQYFEQYVHYEKARKALQSEFPHIPNSASECQSVAQVQEWEAAELASIHVLVPEEHRPAAIAAVEKAAGARVEELRVSAGSAKKGDASHKSTSGTDAHSEDSKISIASSSSALRNLIANATSSPSTVYLPAAAGFLAVVAFGSVFAAVALRRRLFKASAQNGLASPLLEP